MGKKYDYEPTAPAEITMPEIKDIPAPVWWVELKVGDLVIQNMALDSAAALAAMHGQNPKDFDLLRNFKFNPALHPAPLSIRFYKALPPVDSDE